MTRRRRFTADFKARVALEALRGDTTIQGIAARHKVHPNQVTTWKRQAMDGLGEVFSNGAERAHQDHDAAIHALHARIGELTVERDYWPEGSSDEPVYGSRQMVRQLRREGVCVGRHRVRRLMRLMGLAAICDGVARHRTFPRIRSGNGGRGY